MSKQNLVIIIIIIISIVLGGLSGLYFYLRQQSANTEGGGAGSNSGFFNFGSGQSQAPIDTEPTEEATTTPIVTATVPKPIPILRRLTAAPVAGAAFITKDLIATSSVFVGTSSRTVAKVVGTMEVFRWVDRATGNIYETASTTLETTRISNTTVPKIHEAYFIGNKGTNVIIRDLVDDSDVIRTRYATLQAESATSTELILKLSNLPINMVGLAISPNQDQIFSVMPGENRGVVSKPDGSGATNIFNSPFHEWLATWPTASTIVLNTKASGSTNGFAYTLDPRTRSFVKLIGGRKGLTTLMSADGARVLVGESPLGIMQLNALDRKTGTVKNLFLRTLPEKCVWSKKEVQFAYCAIPENSQYDTYPDAWYMGRISFSDAIWKVNTLTNESRMLAQPIALVGVPIDMQNLSLSKNEDFIMFQNKSDLSLWSYQLSGIPLVSTSTPATSSIPLI